MEQGPSSEAVSHSATQAIPPLFMKLEGSLPCSQEPATGPYPERINVPLKLILILSSHVHPGLPSSPL
jgi:hypothetical protein